MVDDCYVNNLAKNQVSAGFHLRVIHRSVSPKFIELVWRRHVCAPPKGTNMAAVT